MSEGAVLFPAKTYEASLAQAAARVFAGPEGTLLINALSNYCSEFDTTLALDKDGRVDLGGTCSVEGRRQVIMWLRELLDLANDRHAMSPNDIAQLEN